MGLTSARRSQSTLDSISLPLTAATCWLLAQRGGEWGHVPGVLSALGAGLLAATGAESVRRRPGLPTSSVPPGSGRRRPPRTDRCG
ncbi:hypothetical protein [Streptomyces sp. NPDC000405]|uniref:hypothetical protein n=1 Tax=Streptomyces sp. NPDC000405 TaxID=3161033 RepID=UPI00398C94BA